MRKTALDVDSEKKIQIVIFYPAFLMLSICNHSQLKTSRYQGAIILWTPDNKKFLTKNGLHVIPSNTIPNVD